jgi:hypothetical protein
MALPVSLTLHQVIDALDASIDAGAWAEAEGICGHCYYVGAVYEANPDVLGPLPPNPISSCKECLVHRSLWDSYLETHP